MNRIPHNASWCLLVTSSLACGGPVDDARVVTVRDSADIRIVENTTPQWQEGETWRLSPEPVVDIGSGDIEGDQLFRVAGALRLSDDRIVVANSGTNEIRFYGPGGAFLSVSGRQGEGPGEFTALSGLGRYVGDSLVAIERNGVSILDLNGRFARSATVTPAAGYFPYSVVSVVSDGSIMATVRGSLGPRTGIRRSEFRLILHNQARGHSTILGTFSSGEEFNMSVGLGRRVNIEPWFGRNTWVAAFGDRAVVASNDSYELLVYSAAGQLELIIRKQHTHLQVTPDDLAAWKRQFDYASDANRRRLYQRVFREMPVPATMPAYGARYWGGYAMNPIVPDALGNLWVREYTRLSDPSSRWTVFDHEGYWFGTVRLPDGFAPFDIGKDYVLGVWRDADDVEHVRLYGLVKPE